MSSTRLTATLAVVLCFCFALPGRAQTPPNATDAESAAIRQVFTDFYTGFTKHYAHATAMTFTEDGDFTNLRGIHNHGRDDIEKFLAGLLKGALRASTRTDIVKRIRFYTPQLAEADADTVIVGTLAADGSVGPVRKGLMICILTKQNGKWLISDFHEAEFPTPAAGANAPAPRPSN